MTLLSLFTKLEVSFVPERNITVCPNQGCLEYLNTMDDKTLQRILLNRIFPPLPGHIIIIII